MRGSYNGFTAAERGVAAKVIRKALVDGRISFAADCSVCSRALIQPHGWHLENYDVPLSAYPICRRCHYAVHIRFGRPMFWQRFIGELPLDIWVRHLTLDPVSRIRPFDETYPAGLPAARPVRRVNPEGFQR